MTRQFYVPFFKVSSERFVKTKQELRAYAWPMRSWWYFCPYCGKAWPSGCPHEVLTFAGPDYVEL